MPEDIPQQAQTSKQLKKRWTNLSHFKLELPSREHTVLLLSHQQASEGQVIEDSGIETNTYIDLHSAEL